jgi:hypothetical protein
LKDESLDISKIINLGRTLESVESHIREMGCKAQASNHESVKQMSSRHAQDKLSSKQEKKCFNCGDAYPHEDVCSAKNKQCENCKKYGHSAKYCKSKNNKDNKKKFDKVNRINSYVSNYEPDSEEDVQFCHSIGEVESLLKVSLEVAKTKVRFTVDTAFTINLMKETTFKLVLVFEISKLFRKFFLCFRNFETFFRKFDFRKKNFRNFENFSQYRQILNKQQFFFNNFFISYL